MENKKNMTNEQLEAALNSYRSKATLAKIVTYGSVAVMLLMFFTGMIPIALIFLVLSFVGGYQLSKNTQALKTILGDNIISGVLKEALGDAVEYNPMGRVNPDSMVFPFPYSRTDGSDHIKAVYKGLNIELSDIELINEEETTDEEGNTERSSTTFFKGQWLICDFGKELAGEVYVSERSRKDRSSMKSNVTMENERFKKRFCVKAENQQEAYYILTPHMMEYIIRMADKSGGTVYLSFLRNGKLHVAVKTGRNFFELGKSEANVEGLRQKFLDELRWFTDIIDTLRVEDTLYKKETNV